MSNRSPSKKYTLKRHKPITWWGEMNTRAIRESDRKKTPDKRALYFPSALSFQCSEQVLANYVEKQCNYITNGLKIRKI